MPGVMYQGRLDFLSDQQKARLSQLFRHPNGQIMPHDLAVRLGITRSDALTVLAILEGDGMCSMKLLVYHKCEPDNPAGAIPYGQGFPNLPWLCPLCEEEVDNYDDLLFDFIAEINQAIEFI